MQYLKRFLRPTFLTSALAEFTVEELFWNTSVEHAGDLTCPSKLCLAYDCDGAGDVCLLRNPYVWDVQGESGSSIARASSRLSMSRSRRVRR